MVISLCCEMKNGYCLNLYLVTLILLMFAFVCIKFTLRLFVFLQQFYQRWLVSNWNIIDFPLCIQTIVIQIWITIDGTPNLIHLKSWRVEVITKSSYIWPWVSLKTDASNGEWGINFELLIKIVIETMWQLREIFSHEHDTVVSWNN